MGGHNKKALEWNDLPFESLTSFAAYHSVTKGGLAYYVKWGKKFRGHEIIYQ